MTSDFFEIAEPRPKLRPFIRRFMVADCNEDIDHSFKAAPTGYCYIGWLFSGEAMINTDDVKTHSYADEITLAGQIRGHNVTGRYTGPFGFVAAECTATGFFALTHRGAGDMPGGYGGPLPENCLHIRHRFFDHIGKPKPSLKTSDRTSARLRSLQDFFESLATDAASVPPMVQNCVDAIERSDGRKPINEIVREFGVASRTLSRNFYRIVGMTPKYFSKVRQMNRAIGALLANEHDYLTALALEAGYVDQSHFIKIMQEFFAHSPKEFLDNEVSLISTFLGKSRRA